MPHTFRPDRFLSLRCKDSFAFGAPRLIAYNLSQWMVSYVDQVIIGGHPSGDAIPNLLYCSSVGRHTSVLHVCEAGKVFRYTWEHKTQRPNTHSYPAMCHSCRRVYSWNSVGKANGEDGLPFKLVCKTKMCEGSWDVPGRPVSSAIGSPYVGTWRIDAPTSQEPTAD